MPPADRSAAAPDAFHHLFFALWPDDDTRERLAAATQWLREQGPRGRWITPARYHLTLQFLGRHASLADDLLARARAAADRVAARGFDLVLERAGGFALARIPLWLGPASTPSGLRDLVDALGVELRAQGLHGAGEPFVPHVTVLRDSDQLLDATLREPVRWRVADFVLVDSCIQPFAPYRIIGRWALR